MHSPSSRPQLPNSVMNLIESCSKIVNLPPTGLSDIPLFPWVFWTLWTNRNKLLFESKDFSVEETVLKILQDSRAWKGAQESQHNPAVPQCVDPSLLATNNHLPPPSSFSGTNTWSLYSDAAWDSKTGRCGSR